MNEELERKKGGGKRIEKKKIEEKQKLLQIERMNILKKSRRRLRNEEKLKSYVK